MSNTLSYVSYAIMCSKSKFSIGQDAQVYYNPDDYEEYYTVEENIVDTIPIVFTLVGASIITMGIFICIIMIL